MGAIGVVAGEGPCRVSVTNFEFRYRRAAPAVSGLSSHTAGDNAGDVYDTSKPRQ